MAMWKRIAIFHEEIYADRFLGLNEVVLNERLDQIN